MASLLTKEAWSSLVPKLKYVLSDCDGVLWNGDRALDGSRELFDKLRQQGKKICYVTNNSTKTRKEQLDKCHKLQFQAELEDVYGTSYATAAYLKQLGVKSVFLIGSPAVHHEITALGIECNPIGPDSMDGKWSTWLKVELKPSVEAVVVGFDDFFSLAKVCRAASYLLNPNCHFVATNQDQSLPSDRKDIVIPGTGCVVGCVEVAAGRKPTVVGKPNSTLVDLLKVEHPDLCPENTLFIGDRLDTDIELGRRHGFKTLLVESGVHKRSDIKADKAPTFFVPSLATVNGFME